MKLRIWNDQDKELQNLLLSQEELWQEEYEDFYKKYPHGSAGYELEKDDENEKVFSWTTCGACKTSIRIRKGFPDSEITIIGYRSGIRWPSVIEPLGWMSDRILPENSMIIHVEENGKIVREKDKPRNIITWSGRVCVLLSGQKGIRSELDQSPGWIKWEPNGKRYFMDVLEFDSHSKQFPFGDAIDLSEEVESADIVTDNLAIFGDIVLDRKTGLTYKTRSE